MTQSLNILHLEDRPAEAELAQRELRKAGLLFTAKRVMTEADFLAGLRDPTLDLILADYSLPSYDGLSALMAAQQARPEVPFIFVSGTLGEETAIDALLHGATDYVLKQRLTRLGPAVIRTMREVELARKQERTLAALRDSEMRFRAVWEHSVDGMRLTDADGTIVGVNDAFCRLVQMPREALEGRPMTVSYRPSERHPEMVRRYQERFAARQIPPRQERQMIFISGKVVDLDISNSFLELRNGQRWLLSLFRDITERKRAETALVESQTRFQQVTEHVGEWVWEVDADGRYTYSSPAGEKLHGHRPEEVVGKLCFYDLFPAEQREGLKQAALEHFAKKLPFAGFKNRCVHKDGHLLMLETSGTPILDAQGTLAGYRGVDTDITERERAETRIREQASLLDLARDGITVRDLEGCVRYWNKGSERIVGWTAEEVMGRSMDEFLKLDAAVVNPILQTLFEKGEWIGEIKVTAKNGRLATVLSRCTLVRDTQGRPKSVLVISTDITEQKSLEAQFLRAQRLESIGQLAGGIAHDLNNILAAIMMISPILREKITDPETLKYLQMLDSSAQRGGEIVRQILMFARGIQSDKILLQPRHLMRECARMIQETFPKSITIQTFIANDLWLIEADATQMHQVLMNLTVNARDAMPRGGKLTLVAENRGVDEVMAKQIPHAKAGPYVVMRVSDTGAGITPEILDRIFDPFFTTKEVGKGTGLGLSTVLGIVRNHDGFIQVQSEAGKGTEFQVYLPATAHTAVPAETTDALSLHGREELILVVDDESSLRDVTRKILEKHGYRAMVASDGVEAVALFSQHKSEIRAVLTDIMMPNLDGLSVIRILKKIEPRVRVVACSGVTDQDHKAELQEMGVANFLEKPFSVSRLLEALAAVLRA